jgi:hypothetical protein
MGRDNNEEDGLDLDADADTRGISTIMPHPHKLESGTEEDERP